MKIPLEKLPPKSPQSVFTLVKGEYVLDDFDVVWMVKGPVSKINRLDDGKVPLMAQQVVLMKDARRKWLEGVEQEVYLPFDEGAYVQVYSDLEIMAALAS